MSVPSALNARGRAAVRRVGRADLMVGIPSFGNADTIGHVVRAATAGMVQYFPDLTPVLVNARSEVLVDHCQKSNAGLYYADRDEFAEALKILVADQRLRAAMGANGRDYIRKNYRWDVILSKYERMFNALRKR